MSLGRDGRRNYTALESIYPEHDTLTLEQYMKARCVDVGPRVLINRKVKA